ncbi:MAG TPA: hypothetical protein VGQ42_15625 [Candidatus Dormibacteraeota bacterium]|jgi:hypothetical protein|nr:hypothetical protein [Candidatus Dormibacteraeota bacterium]
MAATTRIVTGSATPIQAQWYTPGTETLVDPDVSTNVTCTVVHVNGTAIATNVVATKPATGTTQIVLPSQTVPADLIATWTGTYGGSVRSQVTYISVAGAFYVELADIRALDALVGNTTAYPTAILTQKRAAAEDLFEAVTGRAWVKRYAREVLDGDPTYRRAYMPVDQLAYVVPSRRLSLRYAPTRDLLAVSIDGTVAADLTLFTLYSGEIERSRTSPGFTRGLQNVVVEYTYGADAPPFELREQFLVYVRAMILDTTNRLSERAIAVTNESGTISIAQAKAWDRPTGISTVDAALARFGNQLASFA